MIAGAPAIMVTVLDGWILSFFRDGEHVVAMEALEASARDKARALGSVAAAATLVRTLEGSIGPSPGANSGVLIMEISIFGAKLLTVVAVAPSPVGAVGRGWIDTFGDEVLAPVIAILDIWLTSSFRATTVAVAEVPTVESAGILGNFVAVAPPAASPRDKAAVVTLVLALVSTTEGLAGANWGAEALVGSTFETLGVSVVPVAVGDCLGSSIAPAFVRALDAFETVGEGDALTVELEVAPPTRGDVCAFESILLC